jgi:hypothetical protein
MQLVVERLSHLHEALAFCQSLRQQRRKWPAEDSTRQAGAREAMMLFSILNAFILRVKIDFATRIEPEQCRSSHRRRFPIPNKETDSR